MHFYLRKISNCMYKKHPTQMELSKTGLGSLGIEQGYSGQEESIAPYLWSSRNRPMKDSCRSAHERLTAHRLWSATCHSKQSTVALYQLQNKLFGVGYSMANEPRMLLNVAFEVRSWLLRQKSAKAPV